MQAAGSDRSDSEASEVVPSSRSDAANYPHNPGAAGARAAAISGLYRLGEAEMRELIRVRMLDEADPLVKRTFEWEESRADELSR